MKRLAGLGQRKKRPTVVTGCRQHGFCPGCQMEELERAIQILARQVAELSEHIDRLEQRGDERGEV